MSKTHRATFIGLISIVLWGALALLTTLTGGGIPAFQLMAMTFGLAFLLMFVRCLFQGHLGLKYLRQFPMAWIIGVGGYFGYHFCYFLAMNNAPAVEVSLIAYLWPLFLVLFATLLPQVRFQYRYVSGAVVALFGCWILIGQGSTGLNSEYIFGYMLAFLCALIWSLYSIASRIISAVPTEAVGWFCGVTALLATCCHVYWEQTVWQLTSRQLIGVFGLGLGPVGIAFFTWDYGVKHGDIQMLGVLSYMAPLISVILLVLAGESDATWTLAGACVCIVGGSLLAGLSKKGETTD